MLGVCLYGQAAPGKAGDRWRKADGQCLLLW